MHTYIVLCSVFFSTDTIIRLCYNQCIKSSTVSGAWPNKNPVHPYFSTDFTTTRALGWNRSLEESCPKLGRVNLKKPIAR